MTKPRTVTITLTQQQLTDIRVSVLTRLDLIKPSLDSTDEAKERYARVKSLMTEGGPLWTAMMQSYLKAVTDITR